MKIEILVQASWRPQNNNNNKEFFKPLERAFGAFIRQVDTYA